jgi:hypothetical protein
VAVAGSSLPVLCGFFAWQKSLAGYYVFPHHQDLLWERAFGLVDLGTVVPSLFLWHGRWLLLVGVVVVLARGLRLGSVDQSDVWRPSPQAVGIGLLALVGLNALFFAKMFWLERYALPAHPGLVVLAAGILVTLARDRWVGVAATGSCVVLGLFGLWSVPDSNEAELTFAYADVIRTHQQAFDDIADLGLAAPVVLTTWPMTVELEQPELGFVDLAIEAQHIDYLADHPGIKVSVVLVASDSSRAPALRAEARRLGLRSLGTVQIGLAPQALELFGP